MYVCIYMNIESSVSKVVQISYINILIIRTYTCKMFMNLRKFRKILTNYAK